MLNWKYENLHFNFAFLTGIGMDKMDNWGNLALEAFLCDKSLPPIIINLLSSSPRGSNFSGGRFQVKINLSSRRSEIFRLFAQLVRWLAFLHFSPPVHWLLINNWDLIFFYLLIAYLLLLCPLSGNPIMLPNWEAFSLFYIKKRLLYCSFGTNVLYFSLPVVYILTAEKTPF